MTPMAIVHQGFGEETRALRIWNAPETTMRHQTIRLPRRTRTTKTSTTSDANATAAGYEPTVCPNPINAPTMATTAYAQSVGGVSFDPMRAAMDFTGETYPNRSAKFPHNAETPP